MPYFVYILRSNKNLLYIGQTNNLHSREKQQLHKTLKAAKFIKDGGEFALVYQEEYETRLESMRREKQLKGWTRAKKEALIAGEMQKLRKLSKSGKTKPQNSK
jgi:putative endonuclease